MHIFVPEFRLSGHHANYLAQTVHALAPAASCITIAVETSDANNPVLGELIGKYAQLIRIEQLSVDDCNRARESIFGNAGREIALRRVVQSSFRSANKFRRVDFVFVPYMDYFLYAAALLGSPFGAVPWAGICMRPSFHHAEAGIGPASGIAPLKRALFAKLMHQKTLRRVFTIDELLPQYTSHSDKLIFLPDPAELEIRHTKREARLELGLHDEKVVILVYGSITERKGLDALTKVLNESGAADFQLLVVGKQAPDFKGSAASVGLEELASRGAAVVVDEFVSGAKEELAFAAADAVWLGYKGHYAMSGVMVLAVNSGKLVIAAKDGLIGYYARAFNLGPVIDPSDLNEVRRSLREVEDAKMVRSTDDASPFSMFTWANMRKLIGNVARGTYAS